MNFLKKLSPRQLTLAANRRLSRIVLSEISRAKHRVLELEQRYPSADPREIAQRLIDQKKNLAGMVGGVTGIFGIASIPADLVAMTWLQLGLLVDIATVFKVNLKSEHARDELLDLFGYANGLGPMQRMGPQVLGKVAATLLNRGGLTTLGRVMPLVAAPVTAYLNNTHIQDVGEEAVRYYAGFGKAREKLRKVSGS